MLQLLPFQRSISVRRPLLVRRNPTAKQLAIVGQEIAVSARWVLGAAAGTMDQLAPFQRSINAALDVWVNVSPTAKQLVVEGHARPDNPPCPPDGTGPLAIDQTPPVDSPTSGSSPVISVRNEPTVTHFDAVGHATPVYVPLTGARLLGLATRDH